MAMLHPLSRCLPHLLRLVRAALLALGTVLVPAHALDVQGLLGLPLVPQPTNVHAAATAAVAEVAERARLRNIAVTLDVPQELNVDIDPDALRTSHSLEFSLL